jgi:anti-sigma-K factor RskA
MSTLYLFPPDQEQPEDRDLLAAEYALGQLDAGDAAALRLRAEADADLRHAIAVWQARLALLIEILPRETPPAALWQRLAADIGLPEPRPTPIPTPPPITPPADIPPPQQAEPVPPPNLFASLSEPAPASARANAKAEPPDMWQPVRTTVAPPPPVPTPPPAPPPTVPPSQVQPEPTPRPAWHQRLLVWRAATVILLILTTLLAARALIPHGGTRQVAAIGPTGAPAPLFLAETDTAGHLVITPLATIAVPNGRDLELWTVPADHATPPAPLGVLPPNGRRFDLPTLLPEGTQLLVSMEPRGGAAGGSLTGPVLYAGTLANH